MTDTPASGRISISLSPDKRQMIGLTLARVERRALDTARSARPPW